MWECDVLAGSGEHLPALQALHNIAVAIGEALSLQASSPVSFRVGYHAVPSLRPMHIHIISEDFSSDCLKNKKHYQSFCFPFFIPVQKVSAIVL